MKYKLIIDKDAEEEIIAIVRAPSSLTAQIEDLVRDFSGEDFRRALEWYEKQELEKAQSLGSSRGRTR